jgi:hypothetical protein
MDLLEEFRKDLDNKSKPVLVAMRRHYEASVALVDAQNRAALGQAVDVKGAEWAAARAAHFIENGQGHLSAARVSAANAARALRGEA